MLRIADLVIRWRWAVIAAVIALTGWLGWEARGIGLNADFSTYLRQDDPLVREYERVGRVFGGDETGVVLVETHDVFTAGTLRLLSSLTDAYRRVHGVAHVTSLANAIDFRSEADGLEIGRLLKDGAPPDDPAELASLRRYVLGRDRYVGNLVSGDGTVAAILLRFADTAKGGQFGTATRVGTATDSVLASSPPPAGSQVSYGGMPFLIYNMTRLITENLTVLVPLMVLVLAIILFAGFRHWAGVVFPLLVVAVSTIWVLGIMALAGVDLNLLTGIMPVVLLALGSADGIHLLKRYFERRRQGEAAWSATRLVYREMGTPIVLTTVTTMLGFGSLAVSNFSVIQQFGLLTAVGVVFALAVTLTLLPALLSFGVRPPKRRKARGAGRVGAVARVVLGHRRTVLVSAAGLAAVSIVLLPRLVKDVDWSLCLARGSSPFHAEMVLREKFGGSLPVELVARGDARDPAVLATMERLERRLAMVPEVSKPASVADLLSEMNGQIDDRPLVPHNRAAAGNLWFLIEGEDVMRQLVAPGDSEALIQAKLDTWHTASMVAAVDSVDDILARLPSAIVVLDPDAVPAEARPALRALRRREIVEDLKDVSFERGVSLNGMEMDRVVDAAFRDDVTEGMRRAVGRAITAYLSGPEAEVSLPPAAIEEVARAMAAGPVQDPDAASTTRTVLAADRTVAGNDAAWLAGSLVVQARSAARAARLDAVSAALDSVAGGALSRDPRYRRAARSVLAQANADEVYVDAAAARRLPGASRAILRTVPVSVEQTGLPPVLKRMEAELTPTQVESAALTLLAVVVLLALIFRSLLGAVLAVVPISITILVTYGVMAAVGIGLDSFTAMIASVAVGLGIDYAIHFTSRLRAELKESAEGEAVRRTLQTTGVSIVVNALSVGLGFLVLLAAGGQHIRRFGGLTALTMVVSGFLTLLLLPSLYLWLRPGFLRTPATIARTKVES